MRLVRRKRAKWFVCRVKSQPSYISHMYWLTLRFQIFFQTFSNVPIICLQSKILLIPGTTSQISFPHSAEDLPSYRYIKYMYFLVDCLQQKELQNQIMNCFQLWYVDLRTLTCLHIVPGTCAGPSWGCRHSSPECQPTEIILWLYATLPK